jgi:hypothetical protein
MGKKSLDSKCNEKLELQKRNKSCQKSKEHLFILFTFLLLCFHLLFFSFIPSSLVVSLLFFNTDFLFFVFGFF